MHTFVQCIVTISRLDRALLIQGVFYYRPKREGKDKAEEAGKRAWLYQRQAYRACYRLRSCRL